MIVDLPPEASIWSPGTCLGTGVLQSVMIKQILDQLPQKMAKAHEKELASASSSLPSPTSYVVQAGV
ncbi:hypothetical protein ZEAMMB73_Zm00001d042914 [Zea mays]|uniref:Uncharacterized protein n=1 Tax=Zea mays TaxID=4577 RepID=A0A1D6N7G6_MAIZE|nr:hypothetical protein ZEAMMB73_Zm00001d042914 [Zea mays]